MSVYTNASSNLDSIENHMEVQTWLDNISPTDHSLLFRNNKEKLKLLWGKQSCTFTSEYRHYIWKIDADGYNCFVLSGNRGTSIEVPLEMSGPQRVELCNHMLDIIRK